MNAPQSNLISKTGNVCKALLDLMGSIERMDILYSGTPNWDELITGGGDCFRAVVAAAAGLTTAILADAIYQIKLVRQHVITGNLTALTLMAEL